MGWGMPERTMWWFVFGFLKQNMVGTLGILAHLLRMVSWNLNTFRFGGDWTPQSTAENMTIDA